MFSMAPFDNDDKDDNTVAELALADESNTNGLARRYPSSTPDLTTITRKLAVARTLPNTAGSTMPILVVAV